MSPIWKKFSKTEREFTAYDLVKNKLQLGMIAGQRHACKRDCGRLAGGYFASGSLNISDVEMLKNIACSLSNTPKQCGKLWDSSVAHGKQEPIQFDSKEFIKSHQGHELDWDAEIGGGQKMDNSYQVIDKRWLQDEEVTEPGNDWNPVQDLITYLSTLFESDEHVSYVTESWYNKNQERHLPKKGSHGRTAGELIDLLQKCEGDIGSVVGDCNLDVGAWIRFNPLDGVFIRDENITAHRFALIESDELGIPEQYAIIKELELPVAALVHSGGKSLHAIVKVDADDYKQYRERVDFLYEVCQRNGLQLDRQNRNPSRLSRMPGVTRKGKKQFLAATNLGKSSWNEWKEHIEDLNDDLPDITEQRLSDNEPDLAPELIEGVLREGHKMLLAGPAKAGKSFALIQLCIAMADGGKWFGWDVKKGRVLYVNLELDAKSCNHRIWKICQEKKSKINPGTMDVWNLRGHATTLDKLTPKLIRRALKKDYKLIVIDPIYKVITGDENSASEMAKFCNQFDKICNELGTAVVCCHHHSKGEQGQKNSRDRSSGSGVFSRDPDAILDVIELEINEDLRKQIINRWECDALSVAIDKANPELLESISQDDAIVADKLAERAISDGLGEVVRNVRPNSHEAAELATAWRIEGTVREFPAFPPRSFFYRYPVHVADGHELLVDAKAAGEESSWKKKAPKTKAEREREKQENLQKLNDEFQAAYEVCKSFSGNEVHKKVMAEYMDLSIRQIQRRINDHPNFNANNGIINRDTDMDVDVSKTMS